VHFPKEPYGKRSKIHSRDWGAEIENFNPRRAYQELQKCRQ
jgi:hypothetical protein